jgi:hypothetical protein
LQILLRVHSADSSGRSPFHRLDMSLLFRSS